MTIEKQVTLILDKYHIYNRPLIAELVALVGDQPNDPSLDLMGTDKMRREGKL